MIDGAGQFHLDTVPTLELIDYSPQFQPVDHNGCGEPNLLGSAETMGNGSIRDI